MILLDALFPPRPDQLVSDCHALGADGCWVYVWRPGGIGSWTPAHTSAMLAVALKAPGIVVPPSDGSVAPVVTVQAGFRIGVQDVLAADLEPPNLPPGAWFESWLGAARSAGFKAVKYGNDSNRSLYGPADGEWRALWLRSGTLDPIPPLPASLVAWQFVNDVRGPSGAVYDVSVADPGFFGSGEKKEDDLAVIIATGDGSALDPRGPGATYLVVNWPFGPKRYIASPDDAGHYVPIFGPVQTVSQFVLDRCIEILPPIAGGTYTSVDVTKLQGPPGPAGPPGPSGAAAPHTHSFQGSTNQNR